MSVEKRYEHWTLFLDRDGVINQHPNTHYVFDWNGFQFCPGAIEAISNLSHIFKYVIVVTNQQGIGKGLMTEHDLNDIHQKMIRTVALFGGRIDAIYHCPDLSTQTGNCRKPSIAMAQHAQSQFPDIDLRKSIMVGDQITDLEFGHNAGMKKVHVKNAQIDFQIPSRLQPVLQVHDLLELHHLLIGDGSESIDV